MWPFKYPYTNFHDLNLDWILETLKKIENKTDGIYDYIDNAIDNIDINQKTVDEITKYGTVYTNANALGVKPNDENAAKSNSEIVNNALESGKYLYFPSGTYYFADTLHVVNNSGLIGENLFSSKFIFSSSIGVEVDLDYDPNNKIGVFTICKVTDLGIFSSGSGTKGLYINNRFFTETCNSDHALYAQLKGDSYALELRNSPIENLYISGFVNCFDSSFFIAVGTFRNMFISDATGIGFNNLISDSNFENIFITYCNSGFKTQSESNKFNNFKIFMNGRTPTGGNSGRPGAEFYTEKHSFFTNFEVQENYSGGVYISYCNNIILDIIADANCFKSRSGVGVEFAHCDYVSGRIIALNKNSEKTQQRGIYITDCTDINIDYSESEQKINIDSSIKRMLNTNSETKEITVTPVTTAYNSKLKIRNNTIYLSSLVSPGETVGADTKILSFAENIDIDAEYVIPANNVTFMLRADGVYTRSQLVAGDYCISFSMAM